MVIILIKTFIKKVQYIITMDLRISPTLVTIFFNEANLQNK